MTRVLIFGMTENPGGVESFLVNYYRNIDREKIQFDFLCNTHDSVAYEEELKALGGRTFHIPARSKNRQLYRKELEEVFRDHANEWLAIWVNVSSLANIDYLKIAKKYNIEKRIIHSHNSRNMDSWLRGILHHINKLRIEKYATDFWACSDDAAKWFYSGETLKKAIVIHNAVDVKKMSFDPQKREEIRDKYGLQDKFVIGNVGRLHFQKNQEFAIEVFKLYHKNHPDSVLVLIGKGEDEGKLKEMVSKYDLTDSVLFTGLQKDIKGWISSFDLFLFPSRFEGLSVVAMEAQANGIPMLASKGVIPEDVKMNENFEFFDLNEGPESWSHKLEEMSEWNRAEYETVRENFVKKGFDIETEAPKLEKLLTQKW